MLIIPGSFHNMSVYMVLNSETRVPAAVHLNRDAAFNAADGMNDGWDGAEFQVYTVQEGSTIEEPLKPAHHRYLVRVGRSIRWRRGIRP